MIRIAITGPESSGKTTLCQALSEYYKVKYIPEYAREYLENTNGKYQKSDLDEIAKGQLKGINDSANSIVISDSDFSVMEIWSEYKYGIVSELIEELVIKDLFDLHILCKPDIPWEEDPLRENSDNRDLLFNLYQRSLTQHNKHFITVSGSHKDRLEKSLHNINVLLKI